MYSSLPTVILGFHGCERAVGEAVLRGEQRLEPSKNEYDWLGHGIYFWENSPDRALHFAELLRDNTRPGRPQIEDPFVIGAVIDLGHCFNLTDIRCQKILRKAYDYLEDSFMSAGMTPPENKRITSSGDLLLRNLDCAVMEFLHEYNEQQNKLSYDSVRGVFTEGDPVFPGSGIREKDHIQICVRNPNCIKGYFRVLDPDSRYPIP